MKQARREWLAAPTGVQDMIGPTLALIGFGIVGVAIVLAALFFIHWIDR